MTPCRLHFLTIRQGFFLFWSIPSSSFRRWSEQSVRSSQQSATTIRTHPTPSVRLKSFLVVSGFITQDPTINTSFNDFIEQNPPTEANSMKSIIRKDMHMSEDALPKAKMQVTTDKSIATLLARTRPPQASIDLPSTWSFSCFEVLHFWSLIDPL